MEMSLSRLVKSIYATCLLHFHKNAFANFINVQGCCQKGGCREWEGRGRRGDKLIAKHCEICETEFTCTGDSLALLQLISKVSASCTGRRCTSPLPPLPPSPLPSRHCVCLSIAVSGYCCCCVCVNHHPIRVITESALQSALPQLPPSFLLPPPPLFPLS